MKVLRLYFGSLPTIVKLSNSTQIWEMINFQEVPLIPVLLIIISFLDSII